MRTLRVLGCLTALFLLESCEPAVLDPQGPVGAAEKTILIDSLAIMLAIVLPTLLATAGFVWWFRASNKRARYWQIGNFPERSSWSSGQFL